MKKRDKSLLFLYWQPRDHHFLLQAMKQLPSHRLDAYIEMLDLGYPVSFIKCPEKLHKFFRDHPLLWIVYATCETLKLCSKQNLEIFAANDSIPMLLLLLKRWGLFKNKIYVVNGALLQSDNLTGFKLAFWRYVLPAADLIISYASEQMPLMEQYFNVPLSRQSFVPFGIEVGFFKALVQKSEKSAAAPGADHSNDEFIMAAGTPERDYLTVIKAMEELKEYKLRIYTNNLKQIQRLGSALPPNVELLPGDYPYDELTKLYRKAAIGVIPLVNTKHSCGQTVLLEMLALEVPTIVTKLNCTVDYVEDGKTALMVEPEDATDMAKKIRYLMQDRAAARALAEAGAKSVKEKFTIQHCAEGFSAAIESLVSA